MNVRKAVITAAGVHQRALPLQVLIDRDGIEKPILRVLLEEVFAAPIEEVCLIVAPGDQAPFSRAAGDLAQRVQFIQQSSPGGYAHAVFCARPFTGNDPFLHLVGDHVYLGSSLGRPACRLVALAEQENCAVSSVQSTRENHIGHYGVVGGQPVAGRPELYRVEVVKEKPTPTEAEEHLIVPGLRAGYYLCFFGMHVLTAGVMDLLEYSLRVEKSRVTLSSVLDQLARREQYLALEESNRRYDVGVRYGLLTAQMALALNGRDREQVLTNLLELLATREMEDSVGSNPR